MLFRHTGFEKIESYRYWDEKNKSIDFEGLRSDLENAPENAVIVLHACAHNPTGCDPTQEQWIEISNIVKVFCNVFFNIDFMFIAFISCTLKIINLFYRRKNCFLFLIALTKDSHRVI